MPYKVESRTLPMDAPFTLGNEQFPANWLRHATDEDKAKRGIVWEQPVELEFKDERFYRNWVEDGAVRSEPRDLDQLKRKMLGDVRRTAHSLLSGSDWMIIRETEGGAAPSDDWKEWREAVRAESNRQEQQIASANDVEVLSVIVSEWPLNPDELEARARHEAERERVEKERETDGTA